MKTHAGCWQGGCLRPSSDQALSLSGDCTMCFVELCVLSEQVKACEQLPWLSTSHAANASCCSFTRKQLCEVV